MIAYALRTFRQVLTLISFFTVMFTEQVPRPFFDAIVMTYRYEWRAMSYAFFMHGDYPPFDFVLSSDDDGAEPQGRLLADDSVEAAIGGSGQNSVHVRSPQAEQLATLLASRGATATITTPGQLSITGSSTDDIGDIAAANAITIHELSFHPVSLEEAFMELTHDTVQYRTKNQPTGTIEESAA